MEDAEVTILLSSVQMGNDYGNVNIGNNHQIISFQEKSDKTKNGLINAGVYCFKKKIIQNQEIGNVSLEIDWLPEWLVTEKVVGFITSKPFYDIGTYERFKIAQEKLV